MFGRKRKEEKIKPALVRVSKKIETLQYWKATPQKEINLFKNKYPGQYISEGTWVDTKIDGAKTQPVISWLMEDEFGFTFEVQDWRLQGSEDTVKSALRRAYETAKLNYDDKCFYERLTVSKEWLQL
jgi:hypothetical protein